MGNKKIKAIKLIQRRLRGLMARSSLEILKSASEKIKATLLSLILRRKYYTLKKAVKLIEKFFFKYFKAKIELKKKYLSFFESEIKTIEFKSKFEQNILFPSFIEQDIDQNSNRNLFMEKLFKPNHSISFNDIFNIILSKSSSKIEIFTIVLDFHQLSDISYLYPLYWANEWKNHFIRSLNKEEFPIFLTLNNYSTICYNSSGIIYSWGKNSFAQTQVLANTSQINDTPIQGIIQIGNMNQNLFYLDFQGLLKKFDKRSHFPNEEICNQKYKAMYNINDKILLINSSNSVTEIVFKDDQLKETIFSMKEQISLKNLSCGHNFVILVAANGLVYSYGKCADKGQLGLGDNQPRSTPEIIQELKTKKEIIISLLCGLAHSIALSSHGKIFCWGYGKMGQIGNKKSENQFLPLKINFNNINPKDRAISISAGYSNSIVINEKKQIFWWGTCQNLNNSNSPKLLNIIDNFPYLFSNEINRRQFKIVKIYNTWTNFLSLTCGIVVDLRAIIQKDYHYSMSLSEALIYEWESNNISLPFLEKYRSEFSVKMIPKFQDYYLKEPNDRKSPSLDDKLGIDAEKIALKEGNLGLIKFLKIAENEILNKI